MKKIALISATLAAMSLATSNVAFAHDTHFAHGHGLEIGIGIGIVILALFWARRITKSDE